MEIIIVFGLLMWAGFGLTMWFKISDMKDDLDRLYEMFHKLKTIAGLHQDALSKTKKD